MKNDTRYLNENYGSEKGAGFYCTRCKLREADFTCESCDSFRYFCANCDGYVHSSASKRNHLRLIIDKYNEERAEDGVETDYIKSFSTDNKPSNADSSYIQNNNMSNNPRSNLMSQDYVNMKTINSNSRALSPKRTSQIFCENGQLSDNITALKNQLDSVQSVLNEKISTLHSQLEENTKKYNLNFKALNDKHTLEIRKISNEKDGEIRNLKGKCEELENFNSDLKIKIEELNSKLNQTEMEFDDYSNRVQMFEKQRDYDFEELKNFNENKFKILSENFSQEKTKLVNYYEKNIDKLNLGFKESKEKYLNLIKLRENDIKDIIQKMRTEER